ncbi:Transposon Ty3-G Gag-Pol polyprotein [Gossypium australe]|uniref:Transposon Ty3-G Gag-Pol polyprotein n=1 Tax=Gossypium australe TaxID=47621 RepID=A0A5B6U862_9ROSI|nr:Transposon Ty3-G Gag-Pol polyprotein [Gossypium australe]
MLHLKGKTLDWHHFFVHRFGGLHHLSWEIYAKGLQDRFGSDSFLDPMTELVTLKQQGTVDQFHDGFLSLLNQLCLPESYALSIFISNLKPEIGQYLRLFTPKSLVEGYKLARQVENIVCGPVKTGIVGGNGASRFLFPNPRLSQSVGQSMTMGGKVQGSMGSRAPSKSLSQAELEDRRKKGLCFWCGSKYSPGHKCSKSQVFQLVIEPTWEPGSELKESIVDELQDCSEQFELGEQSPGSPVLSLHALQGLQSHHTMLFLALIDNTEVVVLVDSGSTHNFLDYKMAKRLKLPIEPCCPLKVMVANGVQLPTQGCCTAVPWEAQGYRFSTDFLLLGVKGFDVVLGIQWLLSLGQIAWSFSNLTMQFQYLRALLDEFDDVFRTPSGLPPQRLQDHKIPLLDESKVVRVRPYRYPTIQKTEIEKLVHEMLQAGIIRDSNSPFASPVIMVKKKDGSWRLCVDYRQLNQMTIKDRFPIPIIEELLDELGQAQFFSKLDLRSGYHQIRMCEQDVYKTAFKTHDGHYELLVMAFSLTNAPSSFQSLMNAIFRPFLRRSVLVFLMIYWSSPTSGRITCFIYEKFFRSNQLFAKHSKCTFGATQIEYLGHVIAHGVVSMDSSKIAAVVDCPFPKSVKELRGFLRLSGYYRRFIKNYGLIAKPLTTLLKKEVRWQWTSVEQAAFDTLKNTICQAPVLVLPDFQEPFCVETDASGSRVGAVLQQKSRPVAYFSKALGVKYQALSIYDKEMLAVLLAVKKWHFYLVGRHFYIKTNHQSLKFLSEQQAVTPYQQKWVAKMLGYDYSIIYRKGTQNFVADALSRRTTELDPQLLQCSASIDTPWSEIWGRILASYADDTKLSQLCMAVQEQPQLHSKYSWHGNFLRRRGKIVVGKDIALCKQIFSLFHESALGGYSGIHATRHRISTLLYWKGLSSDVKRWVRECVTCQRCKTDNSASPGLLQPLPIPERAWAVISMNFIEGLPPSHGKSTILVVIDRLTKYGHFLPLHHPYTASLVAQEFLYHVYKLHGAPEAIVSDRDRIFLSNFWQDLFRHLETPTAWFSWLPLAEWWYNTTYHSSIRCTPYAALYGQDPPLHFPYLAGASSVASVDRSLQHREAMCRLLKFHLSRAQDRMKQMADHRRSERSFQVGDLVYLKLQPYRQHSLRHFKNQKLSPRYFGPFPIVARIGTVAYRLQLPESARIHPTFHVSQLKKHVGSAVHASTLPPMGSDRALLKTSIRVLDRRMVKQGNHAGVEVLVEWADTFPEDSTWENLDSLRRQFPTFDP